MFRWLSFISLSQLLFFENLSWAQDERFYRQLLSGELTYFEKPVQPPASYRLEGPLYRYDLNHDGLEEYIASDIKDGLVWFTVYDHNRKVVFEHKLPPTGVHSELFRVRIVDLSKNFRVLMLYFKEGHTASLGFQQYARLFFLTIDHQKLEEIRFYPGPRFFHEKMAHRDQYFRRQYGIHLLDIDKDGTKEISVSYHGHDSIYKYLGLGKWQKF
jgi:hypothetical protein